MLTLSSEFSSLHFRDVEEKEVDWEVWDVKAKEVDGEYLKLFPFAKQQMYASGKWNVTREH